MIARVWTVMEHPRASGLMRVCGVHEVGDPIVCGPHSMWTKIVALLQAIDFTIVF
jgi:hypothetical protein